MAQGRPVTHALRAPIGPFLPYLPQALRRRSFLTWLIDFGVLSLAIALDRLSLLFHCSSLHCYLYRCLCRVITVRHGDYSLGLSSSSSPPPLGVLQLLMLYIYDLCPDILSLSCLGDLWSDDHWPYLVQLSQLSLGG